MLILKTLALEPMHGYGINARIAQISGGVFQINAGSLFPAFRRLERDGLIKAEWRVTENNRRAKWYALTPRAVEGPPRDVGCDDRGSSTGSADRRRDAGRAAADPPAHFRRE
jgi:Transcriptional regulator PadR-like family